MMVKLSLAIIVSALVVISVKGKQNSAFEYQNFWTRRYVKKFNNLINNTPSSGGEVVYKWVSLEYDWPSDNVRQFYVDHGWYIPEYDVLGGIDVYRDDVYVTVARATKLIPSGLNKVVKKNGRSLLHAYPSLALNELGNCSNLQYPVSMATDPLSGYMYVLDIGNARIPVGPPDPSLDLPCPSKIVILDLIKDGEVVRSYDFPEYIVPRTISSVNDLALARVSKGGSRVKYAFISDLGQYQLVVFDFDTGKAWSFKHDSMKPNPLEANIVMNSVNITNYVGIDGIAVNSDFKYVYYSALGALDVYQIPTSTMRTSCGNFLGNLRSVGKKLSQSDGLVMGQNSLFYGVFSLNAVYKWEVVKGMADQNVIEGQMKMVTQTELAQDDVKFQWVDGIKLDEKG